MTTIDYEDIVEEYTTSIQNVLRGFRAKHSFLEMWVPDSDPAKSIFQLVEAAHMEDHTDLSIILSTKVLEGLDLDLLVQKVSVFDKATITPHEKGVLVTLGEPNTEEVSVDATPSLAEEISECYKRNVERELERISHEGSVHESETYLTIRATYKGVSLFALVDTDRHVILQAAFSGTQSLTEKALLNRLCSLIESMPIQEASDHGMVKLEYDLREHKSERPITGICHFYSYDKVFDTPKILMRNLYAIYKDKVKVQEGSNSFTPEQGSFWKETTSDDERIQRVKKELKEIIAELKCKDLSLDVTKATLEGRVHLRALSTISPVILSGYLLSIERMIRARLEKSISLYMEPKADSNILRKK